MGAALVALTGLLALLTLPAAVFLGVQPVWCLIDCAVSRRRSALNKALWIVVMIVLWSFAGAIYGAFSAEGRLLRWLTILALTVLLALALLVGLGVLLEPGYSDWMRERWRQLPPGPWV